MFISFLFVSTISPESQSLFPMSDSGSTTISQWVLLNDHAEIYQMNTPGNRTPALGSEWDELETVVSEVIGEPFFRDDDDGYFNDPLEVLMAKQKAYNAKDIHALARLHREECTFDTHWTRGRFVRPDMTPLKTHIYHSY